MTIAGRRPAIHHVVDERKDRDQRLGGGRSRGPTASGVSQSTARRGARARGRVVSAVGSPRSRPSETISESAPRAKAAKRGTARNALQRVADPRAAVPVADDSAAAASACSRREAQRARDPRQPRAEREDLDPRAAWASAWARRRFSSVCAFIEPETSISSRMRGRVRRLRRGSLSTSPSLPAHRATGGACRHGRRAAARRL